MNSSCKECRVKNAMHHCLSPSRCIRQSVSGRGWMTNSIGLSVQYFVIWWLRWLRCHLRWWVRWGLGSLSGKGQFQGFIWGYPLTRMGNVWHNCVKIVPIGDWGHLLTLTLTSDNLESHIVVNVSSTSNIVPSFINIGRNRFFGKLQSHVTQ